MDRRVGERIVLELKVSEDDSLKIVTLTEGADAHSYDHPWQMPGAR
jgi:hypothetical protein